ncbi:MAG: hypothetical protein ABIH89_02625 [Elusimicrobiota bacterium]
MEKALLYTSGLKLTGVEGMSRIYIGDEFCERLLPTGSEIDKLLSLCKEKSMGITLVTPYLTDAGIEKRLDLLQRLQKTTDNPEIVVNDWGFMEKLAETGNSSRLVLGRLLISQYLSPYHIRFLREKRLHKNRVRRNYCFFPDRFMNLLKVKRVDRIEFNSLDHYLACQPQLEENGIKAHIYHPFEYMTVSRYCGYAVKGPDVHSMITESCRRECFSYIAVKKSRYFGNKIIIKGNAHFKKRGKDPESLQVPPQRIVYNDFMTITEY